MKTCRVLMVILGLSLPLGCGISPEPGPSADADRPRVALVMKSLANEFFKTMEDGARAHQVERAGEYDLLAVGIRDEVDVGGQFRLVEQAMAEGIDALVIAPADSKALVSVCQRAQEAGIVVVNIDNKLDADVLAQRQMTIPFVGPDNAAGARLVGSHLASALAPGDTVAILGGVPGAFNAIERQRGFQEAMQAAGIEVVASQSANWETAKANQVAAALITELPDLDAFLCANDSMALGVVAALRAAGKTGQIKVVGYDNITAIQSLIRDGQVFATADQHADQLAVFGIEFALEMLQGGEAPANRETPVDLVTAESLGR